jgi:ferredoxin-nitrite reductase
VLGGALFVFRVLEEDRVNKIEQIKAEKDGLEIGADIPRYAELGWQSIQESDLERLKWWGVFFRKHTPGHFMMRIRIPNGISSAAQLRAIAAIAQRYGRGVADITTRQQIQLRWIQFEHVPSILDELRAAGLVTLQTGMDNIRNVVGCAVAGLTRNELFDASPVARAFTDIFVGDRAYTNLPRKFNVTITGCRENCVHAETQDIALVPATAELEGQTVAGFNVLVGGKNGSGGYRIATPLDVFVRPQDAAEVCVIMMAARTLPRIARELIAHGRSPDTPVAVTHLNSTEATAITTTLGAVTGGIELVPPVVVVVGEVAALGQRRTAASLLSAEAL